MTEHEKLKEICDKIGYNTSFEKTIKLPYVFWKWFSQKLYEDIELNPIEIIFTQEFMKKLKNNTNIDFEYMIECEFMELLKDPVDYLYNLIK